MAQERLPKQSVRRRVKANAIPHNQKRTRQRQKNAMIPRLEFVSIEEEDRERFPVRYAIAALCVLILLSVVSVIQYAESVRLQYLVKNAEMLRREKVREHAELEFQRQSLSSLERSQEIAENMVEIEAERQDRE